MIMIKVGYDNIYKGGSAQWCTFYITNNFKTFYDYDGDKYYKNCLAPIIYNKRVQEYREKFLKTFKDIQDINDILNKTKGLIYIEDYDSGFTYY